LLLAVPSMAAARSSRDVRVLASRGAAAIEDRRFGDALTAFTEAAAAQPRDASARFGAGVAAFMLGRNDDARVWFEQALERSPAYVAPAVWLGELHYRAGRLHEAIAVYETALTRSPHAGEIEQRLTEWRREADLEKLLSEERSAHFLVRFDGSAPHSVVRRVVERLEAAYTRVGEALAAYPPQTITVVLYSRDQYRDITRLDDWSAAGFDGRIRVPVGDALDDVNELDRVLVHEVVHAVVGGVGGRAVPAWMNEGLATMVEPGGADDAEVTLSQVRPLLALAQLHRGFAGLPACDRPAAYAYSARAVRRLIALRGTPALISLLRDLSLGVPFPIAFEQRFGMRYEDFAAIAAAD
jgi:tetratricopeptide (TPR) repeat protein